MSINKGKIGNALTSVAPDHVVVVTQDVYDETLGKYQSELNAQIGEVPTKTSDLINDSGFITTNDIPEGAAASTTEPKMDGTAAVGTELAFARGDHRHPTDTSRVPASRKVNNKALSADITLGASDVGAVPSSEKGVANGVAELDASGKVPSSQLPSYVDDVIEGYLSMVIPIVEMFDTSSNYNKGDIVGYNGKIYRFKKTHSAGAFDFIEVDVINAFPSEGETGKIYSDIFTNKTYRWSGTQYTQIDGGLALGETSSTAYYGNKGKAAYEHSQVTSGNPHNVTKSDVGLGNVENKSVTTIKTEIMTSANVKSALGTGSGTSKFLREDGTWSVPSGSGDENVQADWNITDQSSDAYIKNKPTVPTKTSDLINDSGFLTEDDIPGSTLTFATESLCKEAVYELT